LMNGDLTPSAADDLPPKILPTLNRLRSIVFNQVELASVFGVARTLPGMQTYLATAEGHGCSQPLEEKDAVFSPAMMACLRTYGEARWQGPVPWQLYSAPQ
ncbi:MAG: hypothetical protein ACK5JT_05170, partial [Hyphomicrobiaceae bacterium]